MTTDTVNPTGLSGVAATQALARLALFRALRGKALWLALALALLPVIVVSVRVGIGHDRLEVWRAAFELSLLALPIVPSLLVAPSIADELEDKTSAYLWSRALPRWSIVAGKLLGLAPVAALILVAGLTVSWLVIGGPGVVPTSVALRGVAGIAAAALVAAGLVAALATLVPKYAVAASVMWLLAVDAPIGILPFKLQYISIAFGGRSIAGFTETGALAGGVTLVVIGALAIALAIRRITRME